MLGRATQYGLKKNRWVDEREDPTKSTAAAVRHLKDLYHMFGDWYLAMAAYDSGPVTIQKAVEKTGYADFWALRERHALPKETENYVPIFLATAFIAKNPKAFGFDMQPSPSLVPDQVVVSVPTDLRLVGQLIDRPVEELIQLNPCLLRWTTPANDSQFVLNLPPGTREIYERNIATIPSDKRIWWRAHKVEEGETVASLAKKFRTSRVALVQANQLTADAPLEEGAHLLLPLATGNESSLVRVRERGPLRVTRYRVRPGDTLDLVADRFDVSPYQIRRWNSLRSSRLVAGRSLRLYVRGAPAGGHRRYRARARKPSSSPYSKTGSRPDGLSLAKKTSTPAPAESR
jgi:membrane-bound lytic murein transglycosylase D